MGISGGLDHIDYTLGLLDLYTKQAKRCVPEANVSLAVKDGLEFSSVTLLQKIQDTVNTVFDELG